MATQNDFDLEKTLKELGNSGKSEKPVTQDSAVGRKELAPEEIGRVAISEELFISTTENNIEVYIPSEKRNEAVVGQYVVIPLGYRTEKIFAYIKKLSYSKRDAIDDMSEVHIYISADDVGEGEYIELAQVEPLSMITLDGKPVEVRLIPKPNSLVRQVTSID